MNCSIESSSVRTGRDKQLREKMKNSDMIEKGQRQRVLTDAASQRNAGKKMQKTSDTTYCGSAKKLKTVESGDTCMKTTTNPIQSIFSAQNEGVTVEQSAKIYLRRKRARLSPKTVELYEASIQIFQDMMGNPILHQIMPHQVEDWLADLAAPRWLYENHPKRKKTWGKLSVPSVNGHLSHVKTFLNWCVRSRELPLQINPASDVEPLPEQKQPPKAISVADFLRMVDTAQEYAPHTIHKSRHVQYIAENTAIVYGLGSTGARIDGFVGACYGDLETDENDEFILTTVEKGRGGGKIHKRKFGASATVALLEWLDVHPAASNFQDDTPLFVSLHGGYYGCRMTDHGYRNRLNTLARLAGVSKNKNPHAFRHRAIMQWLKKHRDVTKVQKMIGHAGISSTMAYIHWVDDEVMQAHREADWTDF